MLMEMELGPDAIFKDLWEANTYVLIVWSYYNVF
jgi:hypothetical protein